MTTAAEYVNMNTSTTIQIDDLGSSSTAQLVGIAILEELHATLLYLPYK